MNLCIFYSNSPYAAWSVSEGLCDVVERMGHEVRRCPLASFLMPGEKAVIKRSEYPTLDELASFDAVIVSGPEHLFGIAPKMKPWLGALYPDWAKRKFPVLGWLHESIRREDYGALDVEAIRRTSDFVFCPAPQDEEFGFVPLPFGVDTAMFKPIHCMGCEQFPANWPHTCKRDIDLAFIGLMYPKRQEFLAKLQPELDKHGLKLTIGNCMVQDIHGINIRKSAELYADTLRRIKVFLNLPSLSQLVVTKVYEVMACGALLVTHGNGVEMPRSVFHYDSVNACADVLVDISSGDGCVELAKMQCEEIHKNHRLENRIEIMLSKVSSAVTA